MQSVFEQLLDLIKHKPEIEVVIRSGGVPISITITNTITKKRTNTLISYELLNEGSIKELISETVKLFYQET